jgi:hypothetical protein
VGAFSRDDEEENIDACDGLALDEEEVTHDSDLPPAAGGVG